MSQSSISPSEHIKSGLAIVREHPLTSKLFDDIGFNKVDSGAQKVSHASRPGRTTTSSTGTGNKMSAGTKAPVTIVSSFYRIDSGKKHRVSGKLILLLLRALQLVLQAHTRIVSPLRVSRMVDKLSRLRRITDHFLLCSLDERLHSKFEREQGEPYSLSRLEYM